MTTIPTINPTIKYRSIAALKKLILPDLRNQLESPTVVQDGDGEPVAVLLPWEQFCALQNAANGGDSDNKD